VKDLPPHIFSPQLTLVAVLSPVRSRFFQMQQEAAVRGSRCRQVAIGEATNHYEASGSDGFNLSGSRGAHRPPLQSRQLHISIIRNSDGGRTVPPLHSMPTFIASKTCYPPTSYRPLQEQIPRVPNRYGRILRNY
jgi:hypothetical protein